MSKLTLLMIISCILVFALAKKEFLKLDFPECKKSFCPYAVARRFCVKYDDGSIKDIVKSCWDPPCFKNIVGYLPGRCNENGY